MMRKFIVRHFALDYITKCFGKTINFPRSSAFIYPLFVMNGIIAVAVGEFALWMILPLLPLVISLFFGFVYFRLKPIKFDELDLVQVWQYNQAIIQNVLINPEEMTEERLQRTFEANIFVENMVENPNVKFYKPLLFIYHPLIMAPLCLLLAISIVGF